MSVKSIPDLTTYPPVNAGSLGIYLVKKLLFFVKKGENKLPKIDLAAKGCHATSPKEVNKKSPKNNVFKKKIVKPLLGAPLDQSGRGLDHCDPVVSLVSLILLSICESGLAIRPNVSDS